MQRVKSLERGRQVKGGNGKDEVESKMQRCTGEIQNQKNIAKKRDLNTKIFKIHSPTKKYKMKIRKIYI